MNNNGNSWRSTISQENSSNFYAIIDLDKNLLNKVPLPTKNSLEELMEEVKILDKLYAIYWGKKYYKTANIILARLNEIKALIKVTKKLQSIN